MPKFSYFYYLFTSVFLDQPPYAWTALLSPLCFYNPRAPCFSGLQGHTNHCHHCQNRFLEACREGALARQRGRRRRR